MRIRALASRIAKQLSHDKRTLGLMLIVPLLLLTLIYFIFEGSVSEIKVGVTSDLSGEFRYKLENTNLELVEYENESQANDDLAAKEIVATIFTDGTEINVLIDGTKSSKAAIVKSVLDMAKLNIMGELPLKYNIEYVDGIEDLKTFDAFGSMLIGFIVFFFVFLVAGMAFLKERKSGTMEKLLSTPIKRWEIVLGYITGFGAVTIVQAIIISLFAIKVLGIMMVGSIWYVLLMTLLSAVCALTLGMLLSTAANSEFQMMQFIPIVIIPQLFFSGLFDLSAGWMLFGRFFPLTYVTEALEAIMFHNAGMGDIYIDVLVLIGFSVVFATINILLLKRYRKI